MITGKTAAYVLKLAQRGVTPKQLLERARPESSPIHHCFEWDDTLAAEQWRLEQASDLIRQIKIRYSIEGGDEPIFIRALVNVVNENGQHVYLPESIVRVNPKLRVQALEEMADDWHALRRKWVLYTEFWEMVAGDVKQNRAKVTR